MITKKLSIILLSLVFYITTASGQPFCSVRTFNIFDGLTANIVSSLAQTSDDMMWFATWNGLCCYDGYKFTTFRDTPGKSDVLSTNRMLKLYVTAYDDLWCITNDDRLYLFDTETCQFTDYSSLLEKKYPHRIFSFVYVKSLRNGHTWATTSGDKPVTICIDDSTKSVDDVRLYSNFAAKSVQLYNKTEEWILSDKGTFNADGKLISKVPFNKTSSAGECMFFSSKDGRLGYHSKGMNGIRMLKMPKGIKGIYSLRGIDDNNIAIGTDNGVVVCNTQGFSMRHMPITGSSSQKAKTIYVDSRKRLWIYTEEDGVTLMDSKTGNCKWLTSKQQDMALSTESESPLLHEDDNHTIWLVPNKGTFSYFDERRQELVPYVLQLSGFGYVALPKIKTDFIDSQGNMWFSGQHDLTVVNFNYRLFDVMPLDRNAEVRAIGFDNEGRLWAGDNLYELSVWDSDNKLIGYMDGNGSIHSEKVKFPGRPYAFCLDRRGWMWIATKGDGIYIWKNGSMEHYTHNDADRYSLSGNDVYDIYEDQKGRMWIGTFGGGLNMVADAGQSIRFYNKNNSHSLRITASGLDKVRRITQTSNGTMLVSTVGGLVTFSGQTDQLEKTRFYLSKHIKGDTTSLLANDVLQAYVSSNDTLYVLTMAGGLQKTYAGNLLRDNIEFHNLHIDNTPEGAFQSIVEDNIGNLWIARENTVNKYNPKTGLLQSYGSDEIDKRLELSEAKPVFNRQRDEIVIGFIGGLVRFHPQKVRKKPFTPKIAFISLQYQGEVMTHPILQRKSIEVPSDKRNITITFAALDYDDNKLIRYAYKLEGVDKDWNYVWSGHSASFNELPHGHHRLLVKSTNSAGEWMDNVTALNIYAHPTFWESIWGWLLYILIGAGIVYIALYINNLRRKTRLEREMNKMKTNFFTNIGHKLRTPLTLIGGPVTEVLSHDNLSSSDRHSLEVVQRNSRDMLSLVDNMLKYNNGDDSFIVDDSSAPVFTNSEDESKNDNEETTTSKDKDITILVVEDNKDLREFLEHILSTDYNVITAENGKEGLDKAVKSLPDFIVSDVMMPVMDGLTMVHKIKENRETSHIPTIILSAKASLDDRMQGLKEGIDDYITKPFSATYLKQRIKNIISQRKALQQKFLEDVKESDGKVEYKISTPEIVDADKEMMDKLMHYLEEHIGDANLKVDDLAEAVNLGRTAFYSKVKAITGMSPIDLLLHLRMQRAEELVAKSKYTFSQIAYQVGYSDPKYFSKSFKKETGMTPSEYRRIHTE